MLVEKKTVDINSIVTIICNFPFDFYTRWYYQVMILIWNIIVYFLMRSVPSWSWPYGSWIFNYLCNQCLSPLTLWVRIPLMTWHTLYNFIKFVCGFLLVLRFPPPKKTDRNDITEILLKVVLSTTTLNPSNKVPM